MERAETGNHGHPTPSAAGLVVLAFYLPQFHPIPENDDWWGPGFTEWHNVTRGRPLFPGHQQPHVPADLGYYDLRLPETRAAQAELARSHGIHGFVYYHYWFHGRQLLDRPFREVLESASPDFPFCLCWANEDWTRAWDGESGQVILRQEYSPEDDVADIRRLLPAFADARYVRVDGKPLFLVYKSSLLPDPARTTDRWRAEAQRAGIGDLYLCCVDIDRARVDPTPWGFDAAVEFQPDFADLGPALQRSLPEREIRRLHLTSQAYRRHRIFDYSTVVERMLSRPSPGYKRFPTVNPSWDNTARRARQGIVLRDSSPQHYGQWLRAVLDSFVPFGPGEDLVFLLAWNEWGEGNHLEPDRRWGRAYLEETRAALEADAARRDR